MGLITFSMTMIPLVMAESWRPKNNPKFETFEVSQRFNIAPYIIASANPKYIPSEDKPVLLIIGPYDEQIRECTIKVGETEYVEGVDFNYIGSAVYMVWRPNGILFGGIYPLGDIMMYKVEYTYDFGDDGVGIDGTLRMRAFWISDDFLSFIEPGSFRITSLRGTGDLRTVNIKATNTGVQSNHEGTVINWPTS